MIEALIGTGAFDSDDIEGFFHEAEGVFHTLGIGADGAESALGDVETARTAFQMVERFEAFREVLEFFLVLFEEVQHDAFGHLGTDGGESGKMCYQGLEYFGVMHKINVKAQISNDK